MQHAPFLSGLGPFPQAFDPEAAARGLASWQAADGPVAEAARPLAADPQAAALLAAIFGNSPFLSDLALREAQSLVRFMSDGPEAALAAAMADLAPHAFARLDQSEAMRRLRVARRRVALVVGAADISGAWGLEQVVAALSDFAQTAISAATRQLLGEAAARGELDLPDRDDPETGSGYVVLGMGKLGGRELNYSSDIDLIVLFDAQVAPYRGRRDVADCFVRITRGLVKLLQERTADGYVFRTDLRLRPDPGATPIALSVDAAEVYYQTIGQNWERQALIKARAVAGDAAASAGFLARIRPFVWRKNLDFAAIADIQAMKAKIHAHHGFDAIAVPGQDVKLGPGGIREVEFFVQLQQLIAGGRDARLRVPTTLGMLDALVEAGTLDPAERDVLGEAYRYLRRVEHHLQMIADEQTHKVPEDPNGIAHVATFLGHPSADDFTAELSRRLEAVHARFVTLFGTETPDAGSALPTDANALEPRLREMGFADAARAAATVDGWHKRRHRALRTERALRLLDRMLPTILKELAETSAPDDALHRFDAFLAAQPAGVPLLSLLDANPWLLDLIAEIMGSAPGLAETLTRRPVLLDAVLSREFHGDLPAADTLQAQLETQLARAGDMQDVHDLARIWVSERKFQVEVQMLRRTLEADAAGAALSEIADVTVRALLPRVEAAFAETHGRPADGGLVVIAMGRLGARAMTPTSDLDLIFVYESSDDLAPTVAAQRPLAVATWYARLSQRLITALTALTGEGRLYEVDMRLRPSGSKGPAAVSRAGFESYQATEAWTWEQMALTRARVIAGPPEIAARVEAGIRDALRRTRDAEAVRRDVADMRQRLEKEFGTSDPWSLKQVAGGIVDLEFIAQYLILAHAHDHAAIVLRDIAEVFEVAGRLAIIPAEDAAALADAARFERSVLGQMRLLAGADGGLAGAPEGLRRAIVRALGAESFEALETRLRTVQADVRARYLRLVGRPAAHHIDATAGDAGQDGESDG
jgi:glutamate-ammonia-ligase adenylyltransferase